MPKSKDEILSELWSSSFIDDLVFTITSGNQLADELKAELFVILLEMDEVRIKKAWSGNYLNYLCVNILKKQYHSGTSPFHNKFRRDRIGGERMVDVEPFYQSESNFKYNSVLEVGLIGDEFNDEVIEKILWFVDNKLDLVDRELFKIYYKIGRYDRWLGDLRDESCSKAISSLRKVEKKLAIMTVDGKKISIGYDTIRLSLNRSLMRIKHYLKENGFFD